MGKPQNFEKEKIQVVYEVKTFNFTEDKTVAKYGDKAKKMVTGFKKNDAWGFGFVVDKTKVSRVSAVTYPGGFNGHSATEGWCWQLDAAEVGKGSSDRLVMAGKASDVTISSQKADGTVQVGTATFNKIKVELAIKGTFRVIENYH